MYATPRVTTRTESVCAAPDGNPARLSWVASGSDSVTAPTAEERKPASVTPI